MSQPLPGLDLPAVEAYLGDALGGLSGPLRAELVEGGRSNLTYRVEDGTRVWALRRPPLGAVAQSANDVLREYRVMAALSGAAAGVPVPTPVHACADPAVLGTPFTLVAWVDGVVLREPSQLAAVGPAAATACVDELVDVLVRLHAVPYERVGLGDLGRPEGYLGRQVERWRRQWTFVATRPADLVDRLYVALGGAVPPQGPPGVVHGDYRLDNLLYDESLATVRAVVDWEMATVGDPLADLGLLLVYWGREAGAVLPGGNPVAGFDPEVPPAAVVARYAARSDRDLGHLAFYRALGCFKLAVIAEGIHQRHLAGLTVGSGFESVGGAVEPLLRQGLAELDR